MKNIENTQEVNTALPPVTKAVIAAAGLGTRLLPMTKSIPKEMLPVFSGGEFKPVIQLVIEDALAAGVKYPIIVTGAAKRAIEDYFDHDTELENELRERGKIAEAELLERLANLVNPVYIRQKGEPKGNARPILNSAHLLGNEPFFVFFADDFFDAIPSRAQQLLETYQKTGKSVISLINVERSEADRYGMATVTDQLDDKTWRVGGLVEKPGAEATPSTLASIGGYLLTPDILPIIAREKVGKGGEIVLADSIHELAQASEVYGRLIEGDYYDTGSPELYMRSLFKLALTEANMGATLKPELRQFLQDD